MSRLARVLARALAAAILSCSLPLVAKAGPLAAPPGAPSSTAKPLGEVEPRVAVSEDNTPGDSFAFLLITEPGSYYLAGNVNVPAEMVGVMVDASGVTLDLNGFSIIGAGPTASPAGVLVAADRLDVVVRDGFIQDFGTAVNAEEAAGRVVVRDVHARATQFEAIFLANDSVVEDCTVVDGGGITVGQDSRVSRCMVRGGGFQGINAGSRSVVESSQVSGTEQEGIIARAGCVVEGNVVQGCASGIHVPVGADAVIRANTVIGNSTTGLRVDSAGNTVTGNTVRGNAMNYEFAEGNHLELLLSEIPETLSWPCSATLQGTLTGVAGSSGVTIASDNVTLDLGGHALVGASNLDSGMAGVLVEPGGSTAPRSVIVRNGALHNWDLGLDGVGATSLLAENILAHGCGYAGFRAGENAVLRACTATASVERGFVAGSNVSLTDCTVENAWVGFGLDGGTVTGCSVTTSTFGFWGSNATLENCNARYCETGFEFQDSTLRGCEATSCNDYGFELGRSTARECLAYQAGRSGFQAFTCVLVNNTAGACGGVFDPEDVDRGAFVLYYSTLADGNTAFNSLRGFVVRTDRNVLLRNRATNNSVANWDIDSGNYYAPIIMSFTSSAPFAGNSHAGTFSNSDPNANLTY